MNSVVPRAVPIAEGPKAEGAGLAPVEALSRALHDTLRLLFRPFHGRRWVRLTIVCLFLGGGTTTAAFHWSLSSLPGDIHLSEVLLRAADYITQRPWLTILTIALGMSVALAWLYLRSIFRFVLVDSIFRQDVFLGPSWRELRTLGQSYFFWLIGMLAALGVVFSAIVIAVYPYFQAAAAGDADRLLPSLLLVAVLAGIALAGLVVALLVVLTDDLVVPLMYAGGLPLARAWRAIAAAMRKEPASFAVYLLLRLAVAIGVSVAVLFFLFPVLLGLFSAALIAAALVVLILRVLGLGWAWNSSTIFLAVVALLLLSSVILVLLSAVGMPGQVFLQDFGVQFITSRFPPLQALWRVHRGLPTHLDKAGHRP